MLEPIVKRCAGLDVHKRVVVATVLVEQPDGQVSQQTRSFGTFRPDRDALCGWLGEAGVELAVMESTGNYWKSSYAALVLLCQITYPTLLYSLSCCLRWAESVAD